MSPAGMTDDEIRALVRNAIARHLGDDAALRPRPEGTAQPPAARPVPIAFGRYVLQRTADHGM